MEETIKENLRELAAKENIKILYACESGSRAWRRAFLINSSNSSIDGGEMVFSMIASFQATTTNCEPASCGCRIPIHAPI